MSQDMHKSPLGAAKAGGQSQAVARSDTRLFSLVELRLFRYTAVMLSSVVLAALIGVVVWSLGWIINMFYNLLLPLALAGVLALVLFPVVEFLQRKLRMPRVLSVLVVLLAFFAGIAGLVVLLVPTVVNQFIQLMEVLPETVAGWEEHFTERYPELSAMVSSRMEGNGDEESSSLMRGTGRTIRSYIGLVAGISFVPLFLFFTLLSGKRLRGQASEVLSVFRKHTREKVLYFIEVFVGYVTAFFQGQLIIAMVMGVLYAVSFTVVGLEFGVLAGLVLGLLNIVPFLGTVIGLLVILPIAYLQQGGGIELLLLILLAFAVVQLIESWLLTPKIMADRSGLHPALVVVSLFFWGTALGGIIGMVLAVPLTAFFVAIWSEIKASLKRALSSREYARAGDEG